MIARGAWILVVGACAADPAPPTARIVSVGPDAIAIHDDAANDLRVAIAYTDPDGNLGEGEIVVSDCRSAAAERVLPIPAIAVDPEPGVAIHGELEVVVADVGAIPEDAPPEACADDGRGPGSFCFVLRDRGGAESDAVCTDPVAIED